MTIIDSSTHSAWIESFKANVQSLGRSVVEVSELQDIRRMHVVEMTQFMPRPQQPYQSLRYQFEA